MASNIGKLVAEIGLDSSEMDAGLKGIKGKIKGLGTAFTAVGARAAGDHNRTSAPDRRNASPVRPWRQDDSARRAGRAPLRDDRVLLTRRQLDRRRQVGTARDLALGRDLEAHGGVRLRRADHDGEQPHAEERLAPQAPVRLHLVNRKMVLVSASDCLIKNVTGAICK